MPNFDLQSPFAYKLDLFCSLILFNNEINFGVKLIKLVTDSTIIFLKMESLYRERFYICKSNLNLNLIKFNLDIYAKLKLAVEELKVNKANTAKSGDRTIRTWSQDALFRRASKTVLCPAFDWLGNESIFNIFWQWWCNVSMFDRGSTSLMEYRCCPKVFCVWSENW